jgi:hypothetical protein
MNGQGTIVRSARNARLSERATRIKKTSDEEFLIAQAGRPIQCRSNNVNGITIQMYAQ